MKSKPAAVILLCILTSCSLVPNSLVQIATYPEELRMGDLIVVDDLAYVNTRYDGVLVILNISDPLKPTRVGQHQFSKGISNLTISGNYVYAITFDDQLQILDVSNPTNIIEAATYQIKSEFRVLDIVVIGDFAYLANREDGLLVLDISNIEMPVESSRFKPEDEPMFPSFPAKIDKIYAVDKYLYVAGDITIMADEGVPGTKNTTWILDVTNPDAPVMIKEIDHHTIGKIHDIVIRDNTAYVVDGYKFAILDISNPIDPVLQGEHRTPFIPRGVEVIGDYAFIGDLDTVQVIDITDPTKMTEVSSYDTIHVENLARVGDLIYAVDDNFEDEGFRKQIRILEFEVP